MNEEQLLVKASVPAQVLEIPNSTFNLHYHNELVTHVKLRVFYQGMTRDKRLFTEEFSNKLLASLPQTPVVGYFDEESEDFVGHNHTQFIYGYVPENAVINFETDADGTKWATTDIVLFTGRKDNIGKVAQKIIGKKHSLELDSATMKYSIRRDERGELKCIELQDGKFVGLSVLGDVQSPAFEGSSFFSEQNTPEIAETYKEVKNNVHQFLSNAHDGGEEMNVENKYSTEILSELRDFMKVTMDEMQKTVMDALYEKFGNEIYPVQWSSVDDIVVYLDFKDGHYYRTMFNMVNDSITFGESVMVKPRFLTEEEIEKLFPGSEEPKTEEQIRLENEKKQLELEEEKLEVELEKQEAEIDAAIIEEKQKVLTNASEVIELISEPKTEEISGTVHIITGGEAVNVSQEKGVFITESERVQIETDRKELENYRRERKSAIIEQYSEFLTVEEKTVFNTNIDSFTIDSLETELAKISMKKVLGQQQKNKSSGVGSFGIRTTPTPQSSNGDPLAELVERHKNKK